MAIVGTVEYDARIDTGKLAADAKRAEGIVEGTGDASERAGSRGTKAFSTLGKVGFGAVIAGATLAAAAITKNIGGAIQRVDTLNNSKRTFQNMGFDAKTADQSMAALTKSILGLPTPLDSAVRGMTNLAATYGDIQLGQKVFSSLNNAILGFGGTTAEVENAIQQLSQLPMDGPLDAQTWNSLRNSGLTPVLVAMAKESGMSVAAMKEAFGSGQLTVQDFTSKLIEMNTKGGGGLKSLEQIARDSTSGIATGWANMNTAITRGIATIIEAIGAANIAAAISGIGTAFEMGLNGVAMFVTVIRSAFSFLSANSQTVSNIAVVITALMLPALIKLGAQSAISFGLYIAGAVAAGTQSLIAGARMAAAWLMALGPIGLIIAAVAGAVALIIMNWSRISPFLIGAWNTIKGAYSAVASFFGSVFSSAASSVRSAWSSVAGFFRGVWSAVQSIFAGVAGYFSGRFNPAAALIRAIFGVLPGFFRGVYSGITGVMAGIPGALGSYFQAGYNRITNIFSGLASWFSSIDLSAAGASLIQGFIDGIRSMVGAAKSAAGDVVEGVRDLFPFSPAKEGPFSGKGYTSYSGKALMGDFAKGMAASTGIVRNAAETAVQGAAGAFSSGIHSPNISTDSASSGLNSSSYNIGTINISSEVDGERWLQKLTNNSEVVSKGLVPNRKYA